MVKKIVQFINESDFLSNAFQTIKAFYDSLPQIIRTLIVILFLVAVIGVLASHILAIIHNRKSWKPKPESHLFYSYFCGSGMYQWGMIYIEAFIYVYDRKWWMVSFAGIAYLIRNHSFESRVLSFLSSLLYVAFGVIGFVEMVVRYIIGTIWLIIIAIIHWIVLFMLYIVGLIAVLIMKMIDNSKRNKQHCTKCYSPIDLPGIECPNCGVVHKDLLPARTGSLFARCECGKFIAASAVTGRSKYKAFCVNPSCSHQLGAANAKQFSIQLIGGNDTGKTAFLASFQHEFMDKKGSSGNTRVYGFSKENMDALEQMYMDGETVSSSPTEVGTLSLIREVGKEPKQFSLDFYDVPDEVILSDAYEHNPLNFGYADGIIIIIDPLSLESVRTLCNRGGESGVLIDYSHDDADALIVDFVNQFSRISGRRADKMVSTPVAVVVNKSDINTVMNAIGISPINYADKWDYCRQFLLDNGLYNAINNLESVFMNVSYFPASAIGHVGGNGKRFNSFGVKEAVEWVIGTGGTNVGNYLG